MEKRKVPMRTCIACRSCKPKGELIRIVKCDDDFNIDFTGKHNGRGCYICDNNECFDKLIKSKILNKTYKQNISQKIYEKIKGQYLERK